MYHWHTQNCIFKNPNKTFTTIVVVCISKPSFPWLQTMKFVKDLGRFCGVKAAAVLGGDSMDCQFSVVHSKPDVVVATPGRFLHLCVEMDLKLTEVEYVVFDEADRLFEMGFGEQLKEIIHRLPESRQTLLFSATLPKVLVEFARAGLTDPVLLRYAHKMIFSKCYFINFVMCYKVKAILFERFSNSQLYLMFQVVQHLSMSKNILCLQNKICTTNNIWNK